MEKEPNYQETLIFVRKPLLFCISKQGLGYRVSNKRLKFCQIAGFDAHRLVLIKALTALQKKLRNMVKFGTNKTTVTPTTGLNLFPSNKNFRRKKEEIVPSFWNFLEKFSKFLKNGNIVIYLFVKPKTISYN